MSAYEELTALIKSCEQSMARGEWDRAESTID